MTESKLKRTSELPPHVIQVLTNIRDTYGYKADSLLGESREDKIVAANRWSSALAGFPKAAVEEAWGRCRQAFPKRPPSLEQFEIMCRRVVDGVSAQGDDAIESWGANADRSANRVIPPGGHPSHKSATQEIERRRAIKRSDPDLARAKLSQIRQSLAESQLELKPGQKAETKGGKAHD